MKSIFTIILITVVLYASGFKKDNLISHYDKTKKIFYLDNLAIPNVSNYQKKLWHSFNVVVTKDYIVEFENNVCGKLIGASQIITDQAIRDKGNVLLNHFRYTDTLPTNTTKIKDKDIYFIDNSESNTSNYKYMVYGYNKRYQYSQIVTDDKKCFKWLKDNIR